VAGSFLPASGFPGERASRLRTGVNAAEAHDVVPSFPSGLEPAPPAGGPSGNAGRAWERLQDRSGPSTVKVGGGGRDPPRNPRPSGLGSRQDVQSVATHELGHAFGLLDLYGDPDSEKTMYGYGSTNDISARDLEPEDEAGIAYIYPILYRIYLESTFPLS